MANPLQQKCCKGFFFTKTMTCFINGFSIGIMHREVVW